MTARLSAPAQHMLGLAVLLAAWAAYTRIGAVPEFMLPGPGAVGVALLDNLGSLTPALIYTCGNMTLGLLIGGGLGLALGTALAALPRTERLLEGPLLFLQTAPKIALAPLFVIWFGLGAAAKLALIVSLVLFPVMVGALLGARSVDPLYRDLAAVIHMSRWQRIWLIELPASLPELFVGFRIGAVQAVVGAVLGEWMSGTQGLGALMTTASASYQTPLLFAAVLLVVAVGLAVHLCLGLVERRLLGWRA